MFDIELPEDDSPIDNTIITTVTLFYGDEELKAFKELCRQGMIKMYPDDFPDRNLSDFILELLKLYNGQPVTLAFDYNAKNNA